MSDNSMLDVIMTQIDLLILQTEELRDWHKRDRRQPQVMWLQGKIKAYHEARGLIDTFAHPPQKSDFLDND